MNDLGSSVGMAVRVWEMSWQAALVAVVVLGILSVSGRKLPPGWRHALWLVVLVRLLLPVLPASPVSLFQWTALPRTIPQPASVAPSPTRLANAERILPPSPTVPQQTARPERASPVPASEVNPPSPNVEVPASSHQSRGAQAVSLLPNQTPGPVREWPWRLILAVVWATGAVACMVRLWVGLWWFSRRVRWGGPVSDPKALKVYAECCQTMGVRYRPVLWETAGVDSPAIFGLVRLRLLLPPGLISDLTPVQLRCVLLHELAHVRRADPWTNWLAAVAEALHWFNPLAWFALKRLRAEAELAADAMALARAGERHRVAYGEAIVRVVERLVPRPGWRGLVGLMEDTRELRRRLEHAVAFRPDARRPILAIGILVVLVFVAMSAPKRSGLGLTMAAALPVATAAGGRGAGDKRRFVPVDLTPVTVMAENPALTVDENQFKQFGGLQLSGPQHELSKIVRGLDLTGTREFGGVPFRMEGLIHLAGATWENWNEASKNWLREWVTVPVPAGLYPSLHLLGGLDWASEDLTGAIAAGDPVAVVRWRYADDSWAEAPMCYGVHIGECHLGKHDPTPNLRNALCSAVWFADSPERYMERFWLYRATLENPHPDRSVAGLELISRKASARLFLLGITLDPEAAGKQPLHWVDKVPPTAALDGKPLLVRVEDDATHLPIEGAEIRFEGLAPFDESAGLYRRRCFTDKDGRAAVPRFPVWRLDNRPMDTLTLLVGKAGYAAQGSKWNSRLMGSPTIPAEHVVRLQRSVNWSGVVRDEQGRPVVGARVRLARGHMAFSLNDGDMNKPVFLPVALTTDQEGRWRCTMVPRGSDSSIELGLRVSHPDCADSAWQTLGAVHPFMGADSHELVEGTHLTILQRSKRVAGVVQDHRGTPLPGARVTVGEPDKPWLREVRTDNAGHFDLGGLARPGQWQVEVVAPGHRPQDQLLKPGRDWSAMALELEAGQVLRGVVQDTQGRPLDEVGVGLFRPGRGSQSALWASTGPDGRFAWESLPNEAVTITAGKTGFAGVVLRDLKATTEELVIVLPAKRSVRLEVVDEKDGRPIANFSALILKGSEVNWDLAALKNQGHRVILGSGDKLDLELGDANDAGILVWTGGYVPGRIVLPSAAAETAQPMPRRLALQRTGWFQGALLKPDGGPAAGGDVVMVTAKREVPVSLIGQRLQLDRGSFRLRGAVPLRMSDAQGGFELPSLPGGERLIAAHETGFANVPLKEFQATGTLRLRPWGQVECVFTRQGQPQVGRNLMLNSANHFGPLNMGRQLSTDAAGRVHFDHVPPGPCQVYYMVSEGPLGDGGYQPLLIEVKPGELTKVPLGEQDIAVVGRVRLASTPADFAQMYRRAGLTELRSADPIPGISKDRGTQPGVGTAAPRHRTLEWQADGKLFGEGVVPGTYTLEIELRLPDPRLNNSPAKEPFAQHQREVIISEPDSQKPNRLFDLGIIELQPTQMADLKKSGAL